MTGKVIGEQPALARVSSRRCRCVATCGNPGLHIVACDSPNRATVVVEAVSPLAQSGCPTSRILLIACQPL